MTLQGLVYVSRAEVVFSKPDLQDLEARAAERNTELGVSGYLIYCEGAFAQYLEGERLVVAQLMDRIQEDERHEVLITLRDDELQKRRFPDWHMRWLREPWLMRLENVLIDQLHWMSELQQRSRPDDYGVESAWRIVDRIGALKDRIEEIARQQ